MGAERRSTTPRRLFTGWHHGYGGLGFQRITHVRKNGGKRPAADLALLQTHALGHAPDRLRIHRKGRNRGNWVALAKHGAHLGSDAGPGHGRSVRESSVSQSAAQTRAPSRKNARGYQRSQETKRRGGAGVFRSCCAGATGPHANAAPAPALLALSTATAPASAWLPGCGPAITSATGPSVAGRTLRVTPAQLQPCLEARPVTEATDGRAAELAL